MPREGHLEGFGEKCLLTGVLCALPERGAEARNPNVGDAWEGTEGVRERERRRKGRGKSVPTGKAGRQTTGMTASLVTIMHTSRANARFSLSKAQPVGSGSAHLHRQKRTNRAEKCFVLNIITSVICLMPAMC